MVFLGANAGRYYVSLLISHDDNHGIMVKRELFPSNMGILTLAVTLWYFFCISKNTAIENGPQQSLIYLLDMVIFQFARLVYQRVITNNPIDECIRKWGKPAYPKKAYY